MYLLKKQHNIIKPILWVLSVFSGIDEYRYAISFNHSEP